MMQVLSRTPSSSAEVDQNVVAFPTRSAAHAKSKALVRSSSIGAAGRQVGIRTHVIRGVVVLEVARRLSDVVEELDEAIQFALADGPRGVVCDLSTLHEGYEPHAVEVLAAAGRHARNWPGIPLGVACPHPWVRQALQVHPAGRHLIMTQSLFSAVSAVLATPIPAVESLRLAPHPTAPRASRNFITRTLLDWQLNHVIPFASLVVSELVASSVNAGTDIDLSVAWEDGALRLTVQDRGPAQPGRHQSESDLSARGRTVVAGLSRAYGVLPTANTGKVFWAVLDAPRRHRSSQRDSSASKRQVTRL